MDTRSVSRSFIQQLARQIKRDTNVSQSVALDTAVQKYGFQNYRHFLKYSKSKSSQRESDNRSILNLLKKTDSEVQRIELALNFVKSKKGSIFELLGVLPFLSSKSEIQLVCEKSSVQDLIFKFVKDYFYSQESKEIINGLPLLENFEADEIELSEIEYELRDQKLFVSSNYDISFKFQHKVPHSLRNESHFNREPMFGEISLITDGMKTEFRDVLIGTILDDQLFMLPFSKLGSDSQEILRPFPFSGFNNGF